MAERDITVGMIEGSYLSWFADLDMGATITEAWRSDRVQSRIRLFTIGDSPDQRSIVVKENLLAEHPPARPRLGLRSGFDQKHCHEAAALEAVAAVMAEGPPDDTLGSLRVLATLERGLVLEAVEAVDLGGRLRRSHGFGCDESVRRAGRWLRRFHGPDVGERADTDHSLPTVRDDSAAVRDTFESFLMFLADEIDQETRKAIDRIVSDLTTDIERRPLQLGLGHGDFAPRNIFIEDAGRVTVFDPLGCQRCPVHEDLAYFALALRRGALVPWIGPLSSARADHLERVMLDGYGLERGDRFRYEAFCVLVILDAWAADRVRQPAAEGLARRLLRFRLPEARELLDDRVARATAATPRSGARP